MTTLPARPRIGLALGSGSARGWAHIGVIRALEKAGVHPDVVCGTSVGALVGAAYAAGALDRLESWVLELRVSDVVGFMDVSLGSGLLKGVRLMDLFRSELPDRPIRELAMPFAAVATALQTGAEVWLRDGSTVDAVRASIAIPGLFTPARWQGAIVVDGGLVNPMPVSLARAMGAQVVIGVDLCSDLLGRRLQGASKETPTAAGPAWRTRLRENLHALAPAASTDESPMPSLIDVLLTSMDIVNVKIGQQRMASEPPDVVIAPHLGHFRLLDFHRAKEAIEEGHRAVERVATDLAALAASK